MTEIKNYLHTHQPSAFLQCIKEDGILYTIGFGNETIEFLVPLSKIENNVWGRQVSVNMINQYIINK